MTFTAGLVAAVCPNLKPSGAVQFADALSKAGAEYQIDTPAREVAWLAQLAHESGGFRWLVELWGPSAAQLRYEGRADLGNTQPGDGYRFRGRSPLQLTGRSNYRKAGQALKLPLETAPDMAALPEVGMRVAAWFWGTHGWKDAGGHWWTLNDLADAGNFTRITRVINGGENGLNARYNYLDKALQYLAAQEPATPTGQSTVFLEAQDGSTVEMTGKETIYNGTRVIRYGDGAVHLKRG